MNASAIAMASELSDLEKVDLSHVKLDPIWSRFLPASGRVASERSVCAELETKSLSPPATTASPW